MFNGDSQGNEVPAYPVFPNVQSTNVAAAYRVPVKIGKNVEAR